MFKKIFAILAAIIGVKYGMNLRASRIECEHEAMAQGMALTLTLTEYPDVKALDVFDTLREKNLKGTDLEMSFVDALFDPCSIKLNDTWDPNDLNMSIKESATKDENIFYKKASRATNPSNALGTSDKEARDFTAKWKALIKASRTMDAEKSCELTPVSRAHFKNFVHSYYHVRKFRGPETNNLGRFDGERAYDLAMKDANQRGDRGDQRGGRQRGQQHGGSNL